MTTMHGMMFVLITAVVGSLFLDIANFRSRKLLNFLRRAEIKENSENTNPEHEIIASVLKEMELLGLIKLKSHDDEKFAIDRKPPAQDRRELRKKAA
jgi:hypothetical protein